MSQIKKFRLVEAIDRAFKEFMELEEDQRIPPNMSLIVRNFAPKSIRQVSECFDEFQHLYTLESKPGHLVIDTMSATVAEYMYALVERKYTEHLQRDHMEKSRNQIVIPGR